MFSKEQFEREAQTYTLVMRINGVFSILSTMLAVHVISKSPPQMGTYKWHLLNIVFWSAFFDFYSNFLFTPMLMFPVDGVCSYGLLNVDNPVFKELQFLFFVWLIGGLGVSLSTAFFYRLAAITQSVGRLHNKWSISAIVFAHIFFTTPVCLPLWYSYSYDYQAVLEDIKLRYPIIYEFTQTNSCLYSSFKVTPIAHTLFASFVIVLILIFVFVNSTLIWVIIRKIKNKQTNFSNRTLALHKQLTYTLIVQFLLPVIIVGFPFLFLETLILIDQVDSVWSRYAGFALFVLSSSHSMFNCLSMILITGPYRQAILKMLIGLSEEPVNVVASVANQPGVNAPRLAFN